MPQKTVLAICGLPTSGKTTLAAELERITGFYHLDCDEGPASCTYPPEPNPYATDSGKDREEARMRVVYTVLHAAVEANLTEGFSLIITATYSRHSSQDFLNDAVRRGGEYSR
jgi:predicted kinase